MRKALCWLGMHRWRTLRTEDDTPYRNCRRCLKDSSAVFAVADVEAVSWTVPHPDTSRDL